MNIQKLPLAERFERMAKGCVAHPEYIASAIQTMAHRGAVGPQSLLPLWPSSVLVAPRAVFIHRASIKYSKRHK